MKGDIEVDMMRGREIEAEEWREETEMNMTMTEIGVIGIEEMKVVREESVMKDMKSIDILIVVEGIEVAVQILRGIIKR